MNFFASQDRARRNTVWLTLLFIVAVAGLVVALYVVAHWFLRGLPPTAETVDWPLFTDVGAVLLALVSIGSLYKILTLAAGGGAAVAASLGGRLISPDTRNPQERRLLNIVGEMALASGCPGPAVYVIPGEGINAFAAGSKPGNAVIGVTQGAMDAFTRDEMQGVIAHEFSHIVHGDMRLNLRLMGIIHGIMLLSSIGYLLLRSALFMPRTSSRNGGAAALAIPLAGLALIVIGSAGAFFGALIRAAVSRQREFLADASAVQYTRNPDSIAAALQKIGVRSGLLEHPKAVECAHLFFAKGASSMLSSVFATHPPIAERIQRVLPQWDGQSAIGRLDLPPPSTTAAAPAAAQTAAFAPAAMLQNAAPDTAAQSQESNLPDLWGALFGGEKAAEVVSRVGEPTTDSYHTAAALLNNLPPAIQESLNDSYTARALAYTALLDRRNAACRRRQCQHLENFADRGVYELTLKFEPLVAQMPPAACLYMLLRAMPALRTMSTAQYERFADNLRELIAADDAVSLLEWSIEAVLLHYLADCFGGRQIRASLPPKKRAMSYSLSLLAQFGHPTDAAVVFAVATAPLGKLPFSAASFDAEKLYAALLRLSSLPPKQKELFLQSAANCAAFDGVINADEGVLLRAFAALLDCPLPF